MNTTKVAINKITLERWEGDEVENGECFVPVETTSWEYAANILQEWARTAPRDNREFHLCGLVFNFSDGDTVSLQFALHRSHAGSINLPQFFRDEVLFLAGYKPGVLSQQLYYKILRLFSEQNDSMKIKSYPVEYYQRILDTKLIP